MTIFLLLYFVNKNIQKMRPTQFLYCFIRKCNTCSFLSIILLQFLVFDCAGQGAGSLDLSFDGDGMVTTGNGASGNSVAIQSDGKIVVAGSYFPGGSNVDFAVTRYNIDGSLDLSFDNDGLVTTASGYGSYPEVLIQGDDKIVVAGGSGSYFSIIRYNPNGSLDLMFDNDGIVSTAIGSQVQASAIALQSDGKLVVAGAVSNGTDYDFVIARYNPNGALDTTFDLDGIVTTPIGANDDKASSVKLQADGKIVVGGYSSNGTDDDFAIVRFDLNGSLDNTFDGDGKVILPIGNSWDQANSIAIQTDGKIVVAGYSIGSGLYGDFALARLNTNGSLDVSFDTDGKVTTQVGIAGDNIESIVIDSAGKIVAVGSAYDSSGTSAIWSVLRYNDNGSLDFSFDTDGIVMTDFGIGSISQASSVAIQMDHKIVVAGGGADSSFNSFLAVARYNITSVGINEVENLPTISLYPNPSHGKFLIKVANNNSLLLKVEIFNSAGESVYLSTIGNPKTEIDLSEFPDGIYIANLSSETEVYFQRLLIQK